MKYAVFKQMHFYYKLNLQSKNNPFGMVVEYVTTKILNHPNG